MSEFLTFRMMDAWWGMELLAAREVLRCPSVTFVPGLPPWIPGVLAVRGAVVPVVDLSAKLSGRPTALSELSCAITMDASLGGPAVRLGLVVEEIGGVVDCAHLEPAPAFGLPIRLEFLRGVARGGEVDRLVLVLELERILAENELAVVERASAPVGGEAVGNER